MLEPYLREGGDVYWVRGRPADGGQYLRRSLRTSDPEVAAAAVREIERAAVKRRVLGPDAPKPEDEITFNACIKLYDGPERDRLYLIPISRRIGQLRIKDIMPQGVRKLARELYPMASTDTWQRQVLTPVRAVINNAHELGKCPPIRIKAFSRDDRIKQDRFRGKESRVARVPGSWPWLLAFIEHAPPRDAALAYFMFRHGARVGQSVAMKRSTDMDLSAGRLRIPAAKGHAAEWVDIDPELVTMIANLPRAYRRASRDRVFGIASYRNGAMYGRWRAACAAAGIEYLSPHPAGRHGYGTEMFVRQAGKVDAVSAAREGRWSSPAVPMKVYAHAEDSAAKVRDAFAAGRTLAVQAKTAVRGKALKRRAK